jgi:hypothetical protein
MLRREKSLKFLFLSLAKFAAIAAVIGRNGTLCYPRTPKCGVTYLREQIVAATANDSAKSELPD